MKTIIMIRYEIKSLFKSMMILSLIIGFSVILNLLIYDPNTFADLDFELPPAILALIGGNLDMGTAESFHYVKDLGIWWIYFGLFVIFQLNNLIQKDIEEKTIDLYLSKPTARRDYLLARYLMVTFTTLVLLILTFIYFIIAILLNPQVSFNAVNWANVLLAYIWTGFAVICLESLCLMVIGSFEIKTAKALSFLILFGSVFLGNYWSFLDENFQFLRYFSILNYLNARDVIYFGYSNVPFIVRDMFILCIISITSMIIGFNNFRKKDIPI